MPPHAGIAIGAPAGQRQGATKRISTHRLKTLTEVLLRITPRSCGVPNPHLVAECASWRVPRGSLAARSRDRLEASTMVGLALRARTPAEAQRHRRAIQRARWGTEANRVRLAGLFLSVRNDSVVPRFEIARRGVGSRLVSQGSGGCGRTDRD